MTFEEAEKSAPNGFHDAKIDALHVDYKTGCLSLSMRLWIGTLGTPDAEEYSPAELRVNRLLFYSIEPPDPSYPFVPDGDSLDVSGADGLGDLAVKADLIAGLPSDVSLYRFFVEQWNSFIYIAGSDIQLSLNASDSVSRP
jgi:hypothetical protein